MKDPELAKLRRVLEDAEDHHAAATRDLIAAKMRLTAYLQKLMGERA